MTTYPENPRPPKSFWKPAVMTTQVLSWVINGGLSVLYLFATAATDCSGAFGRPSICNAHLGPRLGAAGGAVALSLALALLAIRLPATRRGQRVAALAASIVLSIIALLVLCLHSMP